MDRALLLATGEGEEDSDLKVTFTARTTEAFINFSFNRGNQADHFFIVFKLWVITTVSGDYKAR